MTKADLLYYLQDLDDNAIITVVDDNQNCSWDIMELRTKPNNKDFASIIINKG